MGWARTHPGSVVFILGWVNGLTNYTCAEGSAQINRFCAGKASVGLVDINFAITVLVYGCCQMIHWQAQNRAHKQGAGMQTASHVWWPSSVIISKGEGVSTGGVMMSKDVKNL